MQQVSRWRPYRLGATLQLWILSPWPWSISSFPARVASVSSCAISFSSILPGAAARVFAVFRVRAMRLLHASPWLRRIAIFLVAEQLSAEPVERTAAARGRSPDQRQHSAPAGRCRALLRRLRTTNEEVPARAATRSPCRPAGQWRLSAQCRRACCSRALAPPTINALFAPSTRPTGTSRTRPRRLRRPGADLCTGAPARRPPPVPARRTPAQSVGAAPSARAPDDATGTPRHRFHESPLCPPCPHADCRPRLCCRRRRAVLDRPGHAGAGLYRRNRLAIPGAHGDRWRRPVRGGELRGQYACRGALLHAAASPSERRLQHEFADPFYIRLAGVACALAWLALLWRLVGQLGRTRTETNALRTMAFGLASLGLLPFMLVISRPEQPILLGLTAAIRYRHEGVNARTPWRTGQRRRRSGPGSSPCSA